MGGVIRLFGAEDNFWDKNILRKSVRPFNVSVVLRRDTPGATRENRGTGADEVGGEGTGGDPIDSFDSYVERRKEGLGSPVSAEVNSLTRHNATSLQRIKCLTFRPRRDSLVQVAAVKGCRGRVSHRDTV